MALRRSARLQNHKTQQTANVEQLENKKRKDLVANVELETEIQKKRKGSSVGKASDQMPSSDALSSLPPEIFDMVLNNINRTASLSRLSRASKRCYSLVLPHLYKRVSVAAGSDSQISRLIRTLEPHLTIAQREQLKTEGKYRGQRAWFSSELDQNAKPACAAQVRQVTVGDANPGKDHKYIVDRYVEEAFKNMNNLEIVESRVLTKSIAQSLAALTNLQALCLDLKDIEDQDMKTLVKVKNLKHLSAKEFFGHALDKDNVLQSILLNSASTLQSILLNSASTLHSLAVSTNPFAKPFLRDWEEQASKHGVTNGQKHDLTALESLFLSGISFDSDFIKSLDRAIDFAGLRVLNLGRLSSSQILLFQHLAQLLSSPQAKAAGIKLRSLSVDMSPGSRYRQMHAENRVLEAAKCHFIASFNTLQSLEVRGYHELLHTMQESDRLLQAILKHEKLTTLRISYVGFVVNSKIPYLSPIIVATLVDNLPRLREISLALGEQHIDEVGKMLHRGTELTTVHLSPLTRTHYPVRRTNEAGCDTLKTILKGFLSRDGGNSTGRFKWEDHCKLRRVSVDRQEWEVASKFGEAEEGTEEPEKLRSDVNGRREVLYRTVPERHCLRNPLGYNPVYGWVESQP